MLRENQKGDDPLLIEVREKLMHLQKHEALFRHRIQEAAERVQRNDAHLAIFHGFAHAADQLARRKPAGSI